LNKCYTNGVLFCVNRHNRKKKHAKPISSKNYRNISACFLGGAVPRIFYCDSLLHEYGVLRKLFIARKLKHGKGKADKLFFAILFSSLKK
jgi:hypothetical protein